ncbi:MAG: hypothetical protein GF405_02145 [Candidatus Eisenbacteria bacterium]|nr:hypothetical protein [Candidatus Eisenbacteria bacterium]
MGIHRGDRRRRRTGGLRRWLARILGLLVLLLFARQASHEVAHLMQGRAPGDVVFSFGVLAVVAGLIVGLFTPRAGAVVIWIGAAAALTVAAAARAAGLASGGDLAGMVLAFGIPSVTGIIYWSAAAPGRAAGSGRGEEEAT